MSSLKDHFSKVAEIELVYKTKATAKERPLIRSSEEVYEVLYNSWDLNKLELQEQFRIVLLDRKHSCLGVSTIATGGMEGCLVDIRLAFAMALKAKASNIILAHNHPSGNKAFSKADKRLTAKFIEAGRLLDIPVLDHIIITKKGYASLADQGQMTSHIIERKGV